MLLPVDSETDYSSRVRTSNTVCLAGDAGPVEDITCSRTATYKFSDDRQG